MSAGVTVPIEAIVTLRRRLAALPARHPERQPLMASTAELYDISRATLYRLLRGERRPKDAHRADRGLSRTMPMGIPSHPLTIIAMRAGSRSVGVDCHDEQVASLNEVGRAVRGGAPGRPQVGHC